MVLRFLVPIVPLLALLTANALYQAWQRLGPFGRGCLAGAAGLMAVRHATLADPRISPAFKEQALTLPAESFIGEQRQVIEPEAVRAALAAVIDGRSLERWGRAVLQAESAKIDAGRYMIDIRRPAI